MKSSKGERPNNVDLMIVVAITHPVNWPSTNTTRQVKELSLVIFCNLTF